MNLGLRNHLSFIHRCSFIIPDALQSQVDFFLPEFGKLVRSDENEFSYRPELVRAEKEHSVPIFLYGPLRLTACVTKYV